MADTHAALKVYLLTVKLYATSDLTTNLRKEADTKTTGDLNQKIYAVMTAAGTHN